MLREATSIAKNIKQSKSTDSYANHTLVKIWLLRLRSTLKVPDAPDNDIADAVKIVQKELVEGLLAFPSDSYLLSADSELADILKDDNRVVSSLEKAFQSNTRAGFLAVRLAAYYERTDKLKEAKSVLEKALDANRTDRVLNYKYAKHLMATNTGNTELVTHHLQRSFTPRDSNYDAQLLFARQLFINGDKEASRGVFRELKHARVGPDTRETLLHPLPNVSRGIVVRVESPYTLIRCDDGEKIAAQRRDVDDNTWSLLSPGTHVRFYVAFNFCGPNASQLQVDDLL